MILKGALVALEVSRGRKSRLGDRLFGEGSFGRGRGGAKVEPDDEEEE